MDELNFDDLTPIEVPVKLAGKEYVLGEANGEATRIYKNASAACFKYGPTGKLERVQNPADVEPLLVSLLLKEVMPDGTRNPVPQTVIKSWPGRVQRKLFEKAKEISDLVEDAPEKLELEKALLREDCPIDRVALGDFIRGLDGPEFKAIKLWFSYDAKDAAKNGHASTTVGSA